MINNRKLKLLFDANFITIRHFPYEPADGKSKQWYFTVKIIIIIIIIIIIVITIVIIRDTIQMTAFNSFLQEFGPYNNWVSINNNNY